MADVEELLRQMKQEEARVRAEVKAWATKLDALRSAHHDEMLQIHETREELARLKKECDYVKVAKAFVQWCDRHLTASCERLNAANAAAQR
jgi:hypothetical protein